MAEARTTSGAQRVVALLLLLCAGVLSLPLAALAFDGEDSENFILPAQLAGMALVGAVVGSLLPGLSGSTSATRRAALVGAGVGVLMALLGLLVFFLLLNGFDGA